VFDQERFDGLARDLATNRLSRGQVLKSLAAGMFLGVTGSLSLGQTRGAAKPIGPAPDNMEAVDPVTANSCEELVTYIEKTGVADPTGKTYPGWIGVTSTECTVLPPDITDLSADI
jgi:hypothetical protein